MVLPIPLGLEHEDLRRTVEARISILVAQISNLL